MEKVVERWGDEFCWGELLGFGGGWGCLQDSD